MTDTWLKSVVDRIENLEGERKEIGGEIRDVYSEAKGKQYNVKAIRKLIAQRRQKTDEQLEADIERYKAALGMHGSYRKAAKALGITKSKLHRTVPREGNGTPTPPHDSETGEIPAPAESADGNTGGDDVAPPEITPTKMIACDDAPAGALKAGSSNGASHDAGSVSGEEVARVAPPAPAVDPWEAADASFARLQAMKRERGIGVVPDARNPDSPKRLNVTETV